MLCYRHYGHICTMDRIKNKWGGKRAGAGRSSLKKKTNKKMISLSDQALTALDYYSSHLKISRADIVDALCILYLHKGNKDIFHCPACGKPLAWESLLQVIGCIVTCECGYESHIGENEEIRVEGKTYNVENIDTL